MTSVRYLRPCAVLIFWILSWWGVSGIQAVEISTISPPIPVWIDADPACGLSETDDVDDCWALLFAMRSPELVIRGISGESTYERASHIVKMIASPDQAAPVHRGADTKLDLRKIQATDASRALAKALQRERLTVIALGPVTNIATVLLTNPELATNIRRIVAVAGKRPSPGLGFYPGNSRILHLHDLNFRKDVDAFQAVLSSGVDVVLLPYEVASKVTITPQDLERLVQAGGNSTWLSELSAGWMGFWQQQLKATGFHPFDSLTVGYVMMRDSFECEVMPVKIERNRARFVESRDDLLVSKKFDDQTVATYCYGVDRRFKSILLKRLSSL